MSRVSNREKILCAGLQVVHEHGFANASVRDIVQAADVPQGSFTNHFASKEAFGLEIIDRYYQISKDLIDRTLRNDDLPPLERLAAYIDGGRDGIGTLGMRNGCLLGNLAAETGADHEVIRAKLIDVYDRMRQAIAYCLDAAKATGEIPTNLDAEETAAYILQSHQGAILLSKAYRDPAPLDRFKKNLFEKMLR